MTVYCIKETTNKFNAIICCLSSSKHRGQKVSLKSELQIDMNKSKFKKYQKHSKEHYSSGTKLMPVSADSKG